MKFEKKKRRKRREKKHKKKRGKHTKMCNWTKGSRLEGLLHYVVRVCSCVDYCCSPQCNKHTILRVSRESKLWRPRIASDAEDDEKKKKRKMDEITQRTNGAQLKGVSKQNCVYSKLWNQATTKERSACVRVCVARVEDAQTVVFFRPVQLPEFKNM